MVVFFSAALTAQNSPDLHFYFINSFIQPSLVGSLLDFLTFIQIAHVHTESRRIRQGVQWNLFELFALQLHKHVFVNFWQHTQVPLRKHFVYEKRPFADRYKVDLVWPNFCRTLLHILQGLPICTRTITCPIKKNWVLCTHCKYILRNDCGMAADWCNLPDYSFSMCTT